MLFYIVLKYISVLDHTFINR